MEINKDRSLKLPIYIKQQLKYLGTSMTVEMYSIL